MLGRETSTPSGTRGSYFLAVPATDMRLRPSPQPIAGKRTTPVRAAPLDRRPGSAEDLGRDWVTAGQRHLGPGLVVARGVHHDARLRHVGQVELADGQAERAGPRMQVGEGTRLGLCDLVPGPDLGELAAHAGQAADVFFPVRIANVPTVRGAHPGHRVTDVRVVLGELAAGARLGDAAPQGVLVDAGHRVPLPEQFL